MGQNNYKNDDLTFDDIFIYIKKSLPITLMSAFVGLIIGVIVCVSLYMTKVTYYNQSIISFTHEGAIEGKTPLGSSFNKENIFSHEILDKSIKDNQLKITVQSLKSALSVNEMYNESVMNKIASLTKLAETDKTALIELRKVKDNELFTDTYQILYLDAGNKLGLSSAQSKKLLNSICKNYAESFVKEYYSPIVIPTVTSAIDFTKAIASTGGPAQAVFYDYDEICYMLKDDVENVAVLLEKMQDQYPVFRTQNTKLTFSETALYLRNTISKVHLDEIYKTIVEETIYRNIDSAKKRLKNEQANLNYQKSSTESHIASIQELITNYKHATIMVKNPDGTEEPKEIISDGYNDLIKEKMKLTEKVSGIEYESQKLTAQISRIEDSTTPVSKEDMEKLNIRMLNTINLYEGALNELNLSVEGLSKDANFTKSPIYNTLETNTIRQLSTKRLLVGCGASLVLGYILGLVLFQIIRYRKKRLLSDKLEASSGEEAQSEEI